MREPPNAPACTCRTRCRATRSISRRRRRRFSRDVLRDALALGARSGVDATDEAALAERAGHRVRIVDGDASNIKITTPEDLAIAEAIAARQRSAASPTAARTGRAGTGYDLHRLVDGRPLILGGVTIPFERGALGHSDADVVCHAVDRRDPRRRGARRHRPALSRYRSAVEGRVSLELLRRAVALVPRAGFEVGNVDVTVILERAEDRDARRRDARARSPRALGIDVARVSIKGKTNEGVDAVGRGEAIAAHAVALLRRT